MGWARLCHILGEGGLKFKREAQSKKKKKPPKICLINFFFFFGWGGLGHLRPILANTCMIGYKHAWLGINMHTLNVVVLMFSMFLWCWFKYDAMSCLPLFVPISPCAYMITCFTCFSLFVSYDIRSLPRF